MDPRLKAVVILLVGASIGAAVAGGALSYVKGNAPVETDPLVTAVDTYSPSPSTEPQSDEAGGGGPSDAPTSDPDSESASPDETSKNQLLGTEGPDATVSTQADVAPAPSPRVRTQKKSGPVVEEEAEPGSAAKNGSDSVRDENAAEGATSDSGKVDDGGSIR